MCSVDEINRSLFTFLAETYHWNWSMDSEINDSPSTPQPQYLGFTTTRKRFEPGHNLFRFPLVHSYHRNHINISSRAANTHLVQNLIIWEKLTLHRMLAVISQTLCFFDWLSTVTANDYQTRPQNPQPNPQKMSR